MPDANFNIALYYRITRQDNNRSFIVKRDAGAPTITAVGGRWDVIDRPRRTSFTTWNGDDPYRMDVPILIDGFDNHANMESLIAFVNQLQVAPADYSQPPQVQIDGALPVKGATWVLDPQITWDTDNVIWHPSGYRMRQAAVLHLLQYIAPDTLSIKPPAVARTYAIKAGDTLKSISRTMYGTPKYWSALKKANNIRDPKKLPKTIKIPVIINP